MAKLDESELVRASLIWDIQIFKEVLALFTSKMVGLSRSCQSIIAITFHLCRLSWWLVYRSLRTWRFCKGKATSEWRSREENETEQRETYSLLRRSFSPLPRSYSRLRRSLSWLRCSFSWLCRSFSRLCCSFFWFRRSFLWVRRKLTLHSPKKKARYTG